MKFPPVVLTKTHLREFFEELRGKAGSRDLQTPYLLAPVRCLQKVQDAFVDDLGGVFTPGGGQVHFARPTLCRIVEYGIGGGHR